MGDCIFCDIANGEAEATLVWRDELVTAFLDIQPVNAGHIDIVPNAHAACLADLPERTGGRMFQAAMQKVFHVHLHVFPRVRNDGFGLTFGLAYFTKPTRAELEQAGAKIRAVIEGQT